MDEWLQNLIGWTIAILLFCAIQGAIAITFGGLEQSCSAKHHSVEDQAFPDQEDPYWDNVPNPR